LSFVSSSSSFLAILGPLLILLVVVVVAALIGVAVAGRNGGVRSTGPAAYFLFGLSLVTLTVGVSTAGVTVHAISELVGPTPQTFPNPFSAPCTATIPSTTPTTSPSSAGAKTTEPPTLGPFQTPPPEPVGACGNIIGLGNLYDTGGPPPNNAFLPFSTDNSNHFISLAVAAGLFTIAAFVAYAITWRRARKLSINTALGSPPEGGLPLSYAYLVAGLAALSLLVFVPVAADSIFRAIAPGINETSGHADGLRNLVTYVVLSALTSAILVYHLRYAARIRDAPSPSGETRETGSSPCPPPAEGT
jgi:hypothetical protein